MKVMSNWLGENHCTRKLNVSYQTHLKMNSIHLLQSMLGSTYPTGCGPGADWVSAVPSVWRASICCAESAWERQSSPAGCHRATGHWRRGSSTPWPSRIWAPRPWRDMDHSNHSQQQLTCRLPQSLRRFGLFLNLVEANGTIYTSTAGRGKPWLSFFGLLCWSFWRRASKSWTSDQSLLYDKHIHRRYAERNMKNVLRNCLQYLPRAPP